jgi:hypothetical protein
LKNVGILEYYLVVNVEFLGHSWKNQGSVLAISARTYIQNFIPKFQSLLVKIIQPYILKKILYQDNCVREVKYRLYHICHELVQDVANGKTPEGC